MDEFTSTPPLPSAWPGYHNQAESELTHRGSTKRPGAPWTSITETASVALTLDYLFKKCRSCSDRNILGCSCASENDKHVKGRETTDPMPRQNRPQRRLLEMRERCYAARL